MHATVVESDGTRVTRVTRVDGTVFFVRVPPKLKPDGDPWLVEEPARFARERRAALPHSDETGGGLDTTGSDAHVG